MADKNIKIQPAGDADVNAAGQTPQVGATELPDLTAEQIAGKNPKELADWYANVKAQQASATKKSQEAADVRRRLEQLEVENKYHQTRYNDLQGEYQKFVEQAIRPQQPQQTSTPSQPPEYDPYNPEKWAREYQSWHQEQLKASNGRYEELSKKFSELDNNLNVGMRQIQIERYLEKAIPKFGKDVDAKRILYYFHANPEVQPNMENIEQAIREEQAFIDAKADERYKQMIAQKEADAQNVQDVEGAAPFAGGGLDVTDFANKTPAEREEIIAKGVMKSLRAGGG